MPSAIGHKREDNLEAYSLTVAVAEKRYIIFLRRCTKIVIKER